MAFPMASTTLYTNFECRFSIEALPPEKHIKSSKTNTKHRAAGWLQAPIQCWIFSFGFSVCKQSPNQHTSSVTRSLTHFTFEASKREKHAENNGKLYNSEGNIARESTQQAPPNPNAHFVSRDFCSARSSLQCWISVWASRDQPLDSWAQNSSEIIGLDAKKWTKPSLLKPGWHHRILLHWNWKQKFRNWEITLRFANDIPNKTEKLHNIASHGALGCTKRHK